MYIFNFTYPHDVFAYPRLNTTGRDNNLTKPVAVWCWEHPCIHGRLSHVHKVVPLTASAPVFVPQLARS
jgi:hypothetical protein